jgi:hypothetical protein
MELAPKVRVPIWDIGGGGAHRGGLAVAKQDSSGELVMAGRRRGQERWLEVHGAAVSSGSGRCGGARWEGSLDNRRRRTAQCFDGFLRWTVAQRPAWRGSEAHESGAGWSALQCLEQRSEAVREQRSIVSDEGIPTSLPSSVDDIAGCVDV